MKFATNSYNITPLTLGRLLHYLGKLKSRIYVGIQQTWKKMPTKCFDFNFSMRVAVYAECVYVLTEYLKYLAYEG